MIQKVFLIDDDQLSIYLTRFILEQIHFSEKIETYQEAKLALSQIPAGGAPPLPEVIFLDLHMPEMNGWAFLEALRPREQELAGQVKIYILTSSVDPQDKEIAAAYPLVTGFLLKPIDLAVAGALKRELTVG